MSKDVKKVGASGNADEDPEIDSTIDWTAVFPASRIKAQIQRDDQVGRIFNRSSEFIGACSALFLQKITQAALDASEDGKVVTLENVKQAAQDYPFLEGILDDLAEGDAPRVKMKESASNTARPAERAKRGPNNSNVKEAMQAASYAASSRAAYHPTQPNNIEQDEDEYD